MSKIDSFKDIAPGIKLVQKRNWRELVDPDFDVMRKTIDEMEEDIKSRGCEGKAHTFFAFRIDEETQKLHVKVMWLEKRDKECRYYTENSFWGGGCLGTKEIDPCVCASCKRWKPKEDNDENT